MTSLHRKFAILAGALLTAVLVGFPWVQLAAGSSGPASQSGNEATPRAHGGRTTALKMSVIGRPGQVLGSDGRVHYAITTMAVISFKGLVTVLQESNAKRSRTIATLLRATPTSHSTAAFGSDAGGGAVIHVEAGELP